jgi:hypothetical protein
VGRGKVYEEIASDHRLLAILDRRLAPNYLLSADHAICIYPGETGQALHFDDGFYPFPRPRPAISVRVITPENGGTVLYRGSHKWSSERIQGAREAVAHGDTSAEAACRLQHSRSNSMLCGTDKHLDLLRSPRFAIQNTIGRDAAMGLCRDWRGAAADAGAARWRERILAPSGGSVHTTGPAPAMAL